ncbi:MAG: CRISPR-associated protein Csx3 [Gemmatales bacterium]|nr:MAG: CRISPR-associated protein Csx3 [Gemmatales bacterium]
MSTADNPDIVFYSIGVDRPITPEEPLPAVPEIARGSVVVIEGRAPVWRYGMALHRLHGSAAAAVAVYDPRLGAVIVASHHPDYREGQIIDVTPPSDELATAGEG